jgi:hypothetical protein
MVARRGGGVVEVVDGSCGVGIRVRGDALDGPCPALDGAKVIVRGSLLCLHFEFVNLFLVNKCN